MMKAIIFDLQGTLVDNGVYPSPIRQTKNILRIDKTFHEFVPMFERVFMTKKYDTLTDALKEVAKSFNVHPPEFVIEKLVGIWNKNKLLSKLFDDTIEGLTELKKDHKLILVANIDCFSKDVIEKFKLTEYFDGIELSCDAGILKNDEEFYLTVIKKYDLDIEETVVVGDSILSDMKSAKDAGLKAVLIDRNDRMDYDTKVKNLLELKEV